MMASRKMSKRPPLFVRSVSKLLGIKNPKKDSTVKKSTKKAVKKTVKKAVKKSNKKASKGKY